MMTFTDDKHRSIISGVITLIIHGALLLIPILTLPITPTGQTVSGYVTGLVELKGVSRGEALPKDPVAPEPKTITAQSSAPKSPQKPQSQPKREVNPPIKAQEKAAVPPSPPTPPTSDEDSKHKGEGGNGTADTGPAVPTAPPKPSLGSGAGQLLTGGAPIYPKNAQNEGITGAVTYRIILDATGKPTQFELVTSSGDSRLDAAALRSLKRWSFRSAAEDYFILVQFVFAVDNVRVIHLNAGWAGEL